MKNIFLLLLNLIVVMASKGQEMNFQIRVNAEKATTTDRRVFETLESSLAEWLNNQKWTEDVFEPEERINCNIQLTINGENGSNSFNAQMAIQASRPVYGSSYETPLITHLDPDVNFTYEQYQPLEYTPNAFNDNLTSVISFYVYVILGLDYDSFSPFGGEAHLQTAQDIISNLPPNIQSGAGGWSSVEKGRGVNRNRYWMIENLLNPRVRPFRQAFYDYHRQALDIMSQDVEGGKTTMLSALEEIGTVNRSYPNAMIIQMFTNAKSQEIIEIFKVGTPQQKSKIFQVMARMDAANASKYRALGR